MAKEKKDNRKLIKRSERRYSREQIERSLSIADKSLKDGRLVAEGRALVVALNNTRFYNGPDKNDFLEEIRKRAYTLSQDRRVDDETYQDAEDMEAYAGLLKKRDWGFKGVMPLILGGGLIAGLFFLSPYFTGNAISNLTTKTSSIIGAVCLCVGLIGGFFWIRSRRRNRKLKNLLKKMYVLCHSLSPLSYVRFSSLFY